MAPPSVDSRTDMPSLSLSEVPWAQHYLSHPDRQWLLEAQQPY